MKYFVYLLFFTGCILKMNAQEESSSLKNKKELESIIYLNTEITIDGQVYDYRILKHYSEAELRSLPITKLKQIHYLYTKSYRVLNLSNCPAMRLADIDIARVETFRKENTTTIVEYGNDCKVQIELISRTDLQKNLDDLNKP